MNSKSFEKKQGTGLFISGEIARRVFKFFASLQLAMITLVLLIVVLAAGTILESRYNANVARILIYDSPWLTLLLVALVLNLACSAADRLPWKKKHVGFVLTHLGIIVILMGSLVTQKAAVDGQMSLDEGAAGKWVTLREPVLYAYSQTFKDERMIPLKERALRWQGRQKIAVWKSEEHSAEMNLLRFFPKTKAETEWVSSEKGVPALRLSLRSAFVNMTQWFADRPGQRELFLGPAVLRWADDFIDPNRLSQQSEIRFERADKEEALPLVGDMSLPFEKTLLSGLRVRVLNLYRYAYVEDNLLKEGAPPAHAENPAAVIEVEEGGEIEKHTVFARFPDFPTVHGKPESRLGVKIRYHDPGSPGRGEKNELRFVSREDGIYYQVKSGDKLKQGKLVEGDEVETGWMDLRFKAEQVLPRAQAELKVIPLEDHDPSELAAAAMEVELKAGRDTQTFWLTEGAQRTLSVAGGLMELVFGRRQLALGFEINLKDFRIKHDPGTERPAAYESDVVLKDFTRGISFEKTISMNEPLAYQGFRIYQAGYQIGDDGTETSVFAVGRDPGIPMKYIGSVIMVIGIMLMFYTRAYSTTKEKGLK